MAYREVRVMDIEQVIRRWRAGEAIRAIARTTGLDRNTVRRLIRLAEKTGLKAGNTATEEHLPLIEWPTREEAKAVAPHVDAILLDSGRPRAAVKEFGGTGRHPHLRAALGRLVGDRRQHPHGYVH